VKADVESYISENTLKESIVIGHSMGGILGLSIASEYPELLSKLIIVDALPAMGAMMMPNYDSESIVYDNSYNQQIPNMDEQVFRSMATEMAVSMSKNNEKHQQLIDWIMEADRDTYVYGCTDLLKLDLRGDLSKNEIPVIILGATEPYGKETAEKNYREQYKNLNNYSLRFAEGSGHFIMKELCMISKLKNDL